MEYENKFVGMNPIYSDPTNNYSITTSNLYCIPYNEETAHLLGTTDEWKGGER